MNTRCEWGGVARTSRDFPQVVGWIFDCIPVVWLVHQRNVRPVDA